MFRVLGFILGSVVAIAGILFVLGVPDFHLSNFEADQARFDAALDKIREKRPAIEKAVNDLVADLQQHQDAPATAQLPVDDALPEAPQELPPANAAASPDDHLDAVQAAGLFSETQDVFNVDQYWHEFWNPFRSEIAARGFVSQLEKVTGLDYRIMKVKAGVYQVGFAYANDAERYTKLSQISAATGLDFPQT